MHVGSHGTRFMNFHCFKAPIVTTPPRAPAPTPTRVAKATFNIWIFLAANQCNVTNVTLTWCTLTNTPAYVAWLNFRMDVFSFLMNVPNKLLGAIPEGTI